MISLRGPKLKIFAGVLAALCLIAGVYFAFFHSRGFVKTSAVIVDLETDTTGEDVTYWPTVEYTVDGRTYTSRLDEGSSSYKMGKTITVLYDPADPSVVHGGSGAGIYLLIVSAVILAFILVTSLKEKQSQKQASELRERMGQTGYAPSVQGGQRELYFLTDLGTPKYGHRLEDQSRRVLYEAKMTKFTMTQPFGFDFIDHEHGTSVPHLVGHNEESQRNSFLIDNHYTFELDGEDVWKHLKENGVSVETGFTTDTPALVGMRCRILRDGTEIARAEQTSQYVHEEDAEQHRVAGAIPAQGFYRVWTGQQNLDLLFVTLMAFARTGAGDDRGGNYGAILGTLKNGLRD